MHSYERSGHPELSPAVTMRRQRIARCVATVWLATAGLTAHAQTSVPVAAEDDSIVRNFVFASGETLSELRLQYRTVGTPRKDASGTACSIAS